MSDSLKQYRRLEQRLWLARWCHEGKESSEEDAILDEMEAVWGDLDDVERRLLDDEGAHCWPLDIHGWVPTLSEAIRAMIPEQPAYEGFMSVESTLEDLDARGSV